MSSVLERMSENWSGVRTGLLLGCEGNIEMWRGFFCEGNSTLVSFCALLIEVQWWKRYIHFCLLRPGRLLMVRLSSLVYCVEVEVVKCHYL